MAKFLSGTLLAGASPRRLRHLYLFNRINHIKRYMVSGRTKMISAPKPYRLEIAFSWSFRGVMIVVPVITLISFISAIIGYQEIASMLFEWASYLFYFLIVTIILIGSKATKLEQKRRDDYALLLFNEAIAGNIQ